jgi:malate dehydrogenase (oxaloacetate-decarboxylating)(NADP+)
MPTPSDTDCKLLRNPRVNRGSAFSSTERRELGIQGLLPPASLSLELQFARLHQELDEVGSDLQRHLLLTDLQVQERDGRLSASARSRNCSTRL